MFLKNNYDVICFFTPGGVKSFVENFPGYQQNGIRIGAFGENTLKAASAAGLNTDIKAPQAKMPSMVSALEHFLFEQKKK